MEKRGLKKALQLTNIIGYLGTVVVNGLANSLPLNGKTTGQISDSYPNLFVPAGYTFSIWGLIYLLLGIFMIYQAKDLFRKKTEDLPFLGRISWFFLLSSVFNIGWIFAWHFDRVPLSLAAMLGLLGSLVFIYLRLKIGKTEVTVKERYFIHLPFSVYTGWITIATIANVTALMVSLNWTGFGLGDAYWAVSVIAAGTLITLAILFTRNDIPYSLVVVWAFLGIAVKRITAAPRSTPVMIAAFSGMAFILIGIIVRLIKKKV
jgi:hypothetical protein